MADHGTVEQTEVCGEEEALAAVAEMGLHGIAMDMVGAQEDFHFHEFDAVLFVLSGKAAAEYPDGEVLEAVPGTVAKVSAGTVHRDVPGSEYRGVFGFSIDPAEMTQPINKPVPA
ncbi:MAG: hypothetical protein GY812_03535 [Actinomycetia bacterium]|nr:hypothetical protein [Actinomycetes bacterium]